jgi:Skp family chaperone for outer membrane proteins
MNKSKIICASLGALTTLFLAQTSLAQAVKAQKPAAPASPAAAPAPAPTPGPALPGICIYSNERAVTSSTVGKFVIQRLQTIGTQVNAELNAEKTAIETEGKALEGQRATLPQEQFEQKALQLNQRGQALQRKAQIRSKELEVTEQKAIGRISAEIDPMLKAVYDQRSCAILLNRNALFGANASMDVTDTVIERLNAKLTQFAFDRERLDQQAVPGQ